MAGFKLNLKNKVTKPGRPSGLQIKKPVRAGEKGGAFQNFQDKDDEDTKKTDIDAFLARGAMSGGSAVDEKSPRVIEVQDRKASLLDRRRPVSTDHHTTKEQSLLDKQLRPDTAEEKARASLLSGEKITQSSGRVIEISEQGTNDDNSENDYDDVPVEEFGAALLRGMGWDGKNAKTPSADIEKRQKGAVLGIGSKPLLKDMDKDVMGAKYAKLSAPLKRVSREDQQ